MLGVLYSWVMQKVLNYTKQVKCLTHEMSLVTQLCCHYRSAHQSTNQQKNKQTVIINQSKQFYNVSRTIVIRMFTR